MSQSDKVKVLYIAGCGRSGTTILERVLGQVKGAFPAGEVRYLWDRGILEGRLCGCGDPLPVCEFWGRLLSEVEARGDTLSPDEMVAMRDGHTRTRHIPMIMLPGGRSRLLTHLDSYIDGLRRIYTAIKERSGAEVIVDSSKSPKYGLILGTMPDIDLYTIHVVRDPRPLLRSRLPFRPQRPPRPLPSFVIRPHRSLRARSATSGVREGYQSQRQ